MRNWHRSFIVPSRSLALLFPHPREADARTWTAASQAIAKKFHYSAVTEWSAPFVSANGATPIQCRSHMSETLSLAETSPRMPPTLPVEKTALVPRGRLAYEVITE